ncbi:hypothetical protein CPB85DRAFT_1567794 [Mucidula mucida]|nr:hypothetical protein CPB85DRAFT_1567794 [Mucidula mucida]
MSHVSRAMAKLVRDICSSYDWIDSYSIDGAVRTVLSHNDEPTCLQATAVASSKEHIDLENSRITQDIKNLEIALERLRARRRALNPLVKHGWALSKLRWLPDEILSEIFIHACGDGGFVVDRQDEGPWKLRAVCRKWASVVEGYSPLWCNMVVKIQVGKKLRPATFSQALQFSGSRPLHMTLSPVVDTISSSSSRWESITVESDDDLEGNMKTSRILPRYCWHSSLLHC